LFIYTPLGIVLSAGIWIFALTIAYPYIPGSESDAFKGISVFAGLMLSLGSTGFINHVMSGLVIAYSGSMRVGDYVSVQNIEGTLQELGLTQQSPSTIHKCQGNFEVKHPTNHGSNIDYPICLHY
jgi:small-conductance mechanosensitive channel